MPYVRTTPRRHSIPRFLTYWLSFGAFATAIILGCQRSGDTTPASSGSVRSQNGPDENAERDWKAIANRFIAQRDFTSAERVIRNQLVSTPEDPAALELLGDILAAQQKPVLALEVYADAIAVSASPSRSLHDKIVEQQIAAGSPFGAIESLQEMIDRYPDDPQARFDLAGLATMVGAPRLAIPSLRWLMQRGQDDPDMLITLADPDQVQPDGEMCQKWLEMSLANGNRDNRTEFGLALLDATQNRWQEVAARLERVIAQHPNFAAAHTLYGRAIWELGDFDTLAKWAQSIPPQSEQSPAYWLLAAQWAQRDGRHDEAARSFWESLRLAPDGQLETLTGLMQSLGQLGREDEVAFLGDEIALLAKLRDAIKIHLERKETSQSAALDVAEAMARLGRIWEAEAWGRFAVSLPDERVADAAQRYLVVRNRLTIQTPWQLADSVITNRIDLSGLPSPQWSVAHANSITRDSFKRGMVRFEDQAHHRGLIHTCEVAPSAQTAGHWIYHSLGGGVGVIDLDLDGWPDLALAMLDGKPMQTDSAPNRLFRNVEGQFIDITSASGYDDTGFSHGIAIGDYNEDGFPDIFDGNYGQNRLYRNNGDGTFQDETNDAGITAVGWSTSVVIADFDGDGISDLFETHYCGGKMPLERSCKDGRGMTVTCPPLYFDAEPDRVWRGVGDGTFVDVTGDWLNQTSPGRGLGVVAGQFDEKPGLDLYVANDMTANHLWSAESSTKPFRMVDLGLVRGLALNSKSLSQASMGIAVGDPNGDGMIDFFVTHFSNDHNTYYEQVTPGSWADRSAVSGLAVPSIKMLGFGTQWHDFDNHGTPELIIANGHVDDIQSKEISYRMPPQLFQLNHDGKWIEPEPTESGEYFTQEHLGRAVAIADVNRDGLGDVIITHLYEPVALLVNQSQQTGSRINIELRATQGSRDAIGASITMNIDGRKHTAQLTAGDGYLASNQRLIVVGMGDAKNARDIVVHWPSGSVQQFDELISGQEYLLIEGSDEAFQRNAQ